jgi:hypothetical protein
MSACFVLPLRSTAEDGGLNCLPKQSFDGYVNVSIVDSEGLAVSSLVLKDGKVINGAAQQYPIDAETGDMCELILATAEDFLASPTGLKYRFDYRYRMTAAHTNCNCENGCTAGKIVRGSFWVDIQNSDLYTLDGEGCVQVSVNGSTTFAPGPLPDPDTCCLPLESLTFLYQGTDLVGITGETYSRALTYNVDGLVETVTDSDTGIVQTLTYHPNGYPATRVVT